MIEKLQNELMKPNLQMITIFFIIFLLLTDKIETNQLIIFILIILILVNYKDLFSIIDDSQKVKVNIINDHNKKINKIILVDDKTKSLVNELKQYKKNNKICYKNGCNYLKTYFYYLKQLENDDLDHYVPIFDNAKFYLKKCLNEFQSLSVSVPEDSYSNSLKSYRDTNKKTHSEKIGKICTKIHDHCFNLLFNISLKLNDKYHKNPDNLNKEIIIDTGRVYEKNEYDLHELY